MLMASVNAIKIMLNAKNSAATILPIMQNVVGVLLLLFFVVVVVFAPSHLMLQLLFIDLLRLTS